MSTYKKKGGGGVDECLIVEMAVYLILDICRTATALVLEQWSPLYLLAVQSQVVRLTNN